MFGSILSSIVGAAAGGIGSKSSKQPDQKSGYYAFPSFIQEDLKDTYHPMAQGELQQPYQPVSTMRANDPASDPFASQALWRLQQQADMRNRAAMQQPMQQQQVAGQPTPQAMQMMQAQMNWQAAHPAGVGGLRQTGTRNTQGTFADFYNSVPDVNQGAIFGLKR